MAHLGQGGPDEYQTPRAPVDALFRHIETPEVVLEPCAGEGRLVKSLYANGVSEVLASDPGEGTVGADWGFFESVAMYPYTVITNPPWSIKDAIIETLVEGCMETYRGEWALLLPVTALGGKKRQDLYRAIGGVGVLMLGERVGYYRPDGGKTSPHVESCWVCSPGLFGTRIIWETMHEG